ncbi:hypothetical protein BUE76_09670 [Cnuella takakiae]|nr:hypothetical protein BUE76_09670 [Cnuella takakiae]
MLLVTGLILLWQYNRKPPELSAAAPDKITTATALTQNFDADATAADKDLQGKIIRITGQVQRVDTGGAVVLAGDGASEVVVGLDTRHLSALKQITAGKLVVLQGKYTGYQKSGSADDLLAALGTTVHISAAGLSSEN